MAKILLISAIVLLIAVTFQQANALKCWRCSSDASTSAFCDDTFDPSIINDQQRRWAYVDCNFPTSSQVPFGQYVQQTSRPVCKKMKQLINDKVVISRSCSWEDVNAPPDSCMRTTTPSYIKTEFCETCGHDGCNSASKFKTFTLFALVPTIFIFILNL
ncbi:hypothetical protein PVAND_006659 [Polypedilum vanderplanki]|uniref:Protein sleepless n=1 Tax=Polypedilum vanderplanki TaxID=319348 RepID=A0A9J6C3V9_POLVA|nr:hypothetical protein PVAND_006659 [Polypedilum vanderplanki]